MKTIDEKVNDAEKKIKHQGEYISFIIKRLEELEKEIKKIKRGCRSLEQEIMRKK